MTKLVIHAPNIHCGGGAVLLSELLRSIPMDWQCTLFIDERMKLPVGIHNSISVVRVKATLVGRLQAEIRLVQAVNSDTVVVCFGNLPPLFRLPCYVSTYVQNRFIIDEESISLLSRKARFRIFFERYWLRLYQNHSNEYFVQTESMKIILNKFFSGKLKITIAPFFDETIKTFQKTHINKKKYDFIYVATGERHKNHLTLINAWCCLAQDSVFPTLGLTLSIDKSSKLITYIDTCVKKYGIKITNLGYLDRWDVDSVMAESSALIYPSKLESYGLPLVEASIAGLPILAPELDFVRDVINPIETFDPDSSISIARAVRRYLGNSNAGHCYLTPSQFLNYVSRKAL
jgi:glycosyltransferase involved in cell wall biosynthesis